MEIKEVQGYYGSHRIPTTVLVYGGWYIAEGGTIVNHTHEEIDDGVWIEELSDDDCFTCDKPILTLQELVTEVDEFIYE